MRITSFMLTSGVLFGALLLLAPGIAHGQAPVNLVGYDPSCAVRIEVNTKDGILPITWPAGNGQTATLSLDITGRAPLIREFGILSSGGNRPVLSHVDPTVPDCRRAAACS
jgi:hypothetical protein